MPRQARPSNVIDIDSYYARPRGPGPNVIDLTEVPDSPPAPAVPLPGRSSARNPQPHTQLLPDVASEGPPRPRWVRSTPIGSNVPPPAPPPPPPTPPVLRPSSRFSVGYPSYGLAPVRRSISNLSTAAARDDVGSSRTQAIDLTGDEMTPGNIGHRYRYSNNNTPDLIMGEVRRNANHHPVPPPQVPPAAPALAAPVVPPGLAAPFRFGGSYNPFGRIHGIFLDVTRLAFGQSILEPFDFPQGDHNPEPSRAPPLPTREGFTRDTGEDKVAVCPSCNEELAYNPGDPTIVPNPTRRSSRAKKDGDHHFWAVKKCGHVFCSRCFEGRKFKETGFIRPNTTNKINCAVDGCTSDVAAKTAWIGIYL